MSIEDSNIVSLIYCNCTPPLVPVQAGKHTHKHKHTTGTHYSKRTGEDGDPKTHKYFNGNAFYSSICMQRKDNSYMFQNHEWDEIRCEMGGKTNPSDFGLRLWLCYLFIHEPVIASIIDHDGMNPLHILAMNPHADSRTIMTC